MIIEIQLVKQKTLVCYQSALVYATAMPLASLRIEAVPYPRDQYDAGARASFDDVNKMIQHTGFRLQKPKQAGLTTPDVFLQNSGVYLISTAVTHKEDWDCEYADGVPHYVVYNAGTRVLFANPEVLVLTDDDLACLDDLMEKLSREPYCALACMRTRVRHVVSNIH